MSIKSLPGVQSPPAPDATVPATVVHAAASVSTHLDPAGPDTQSRLTAQAASGTARAALTAREVELRHAIPKEVSLQSRLPGVVSPVVRADIDYLQMAAEASIEAQQARETTDRMLDDYLSSALKTSLANAPAREQQLWASIAFEFDHLQAQSDALAGLQSTNRCKLDHLQRAIDSGSPEPMLQEHVRQALEFDQKLGRKRDEVALSIACRDAVLEARLVRLGLLSDGPSKVPTTVPTKVPTKVPSNVPGDVPAND